MTYELNRKPCKRNISVYWIFFARRDFQLFSNDEKLNFPVHLETMGE